MNQLEDDLIMDFFSEDTAHAPKTYGTYKVLIADDEKEVHRVTELVLDGFEFEGKRLEFLHAYSGGDTLDLMDEHQDIAVIFLDVVMENERSGLDVVKKIRKDLNNNLTRIILRTGQPGQAPEEKVIREYDINDYRLKTEMTSIRLRTSLYSALRSYRDMVRLKKHKKGLEQIIASSARMFEHDSMEKFLVSILYELSNFQQNTTDLFYIRENGHLNHDGFITIENQRNNKIIAATGKYLDYIGKDIESLTDFKTISSMIHKEGDQAKSIQQTDQGFLVGSQGNSKLNNFIYIEGPQDTFDFKLINLFLSSYSVALDNYLLNNLLNVTQKELLIALGETVECHFEETGNHVKRISDMMYAFARCCGYTYAESEMLKIACTMHDLGKVGIPDAILKKPAKLDYDEFEIMKTHASFGHKIMKGSHLTVLKLAGEIALNHHEKYNGEGYPNGLLGEDIPKSARMLAILDVYDAMTHKRVYKDAIPEDITLKEMVKEKGNHFDPTLINLFIDNLDKITKNASSS